MELLDIFNVYLIGSIELLTGFHFYIKFLRKKVSLIHYFFFFVVGMAVVTFLKADGILEFLVYSLLFVIGGTILCKKINSYIVLYAIVTIEIMNLCFGIFNSLSCILVPLFLSQNLSGMILVVMIAGNLLAIFTSMLCYQMIHKWFLYDEIIVTKDILMILIPTALIFLVSQYINNNIYGNTVIIEEGKLLINTNPFPILCIQILGIGSLFCILFSYRKLVLGFQLRREVSLLEREKHFLTQYVEEAKVRYEKTKAFRHDVKNHMSIVKELLQNENADAALQYLGEMENLTQDLSFAVTTNNPVLDILIGNKFGIARSNQIQVQCSFLAPYPCKISDIDFCIIFSNALDNAIAACKERGDNQQKYITITGKMQGDFILIKIQNNYSGRGTIDCGTGLANIKAVAEKYHGAMELKTEGETFTLSVLIIIPQHSKDISQQNA